MQSVWVFISGKGGTGKSTLSTALAAALAAGGRTVCLVDADLGLRGDDLMLGMQDSVVYDLNDYVKMRCSLDEALLRRPGCENLSLLPAGQTMKPSDCDVGDWRKLISALRKRFDFVLIDGPAGVGKGVKNLIPACDGCVLVSTPDDVSVRDAERAAQVYRAQAEGKPLRMIVNRVSPALVREGIMSPPQTLSDLTDIPLLGVVYADESVYRAQMRHTTCYDEGSEEIRAALSRIARRLEGQPAPFPDFAPPKKSFLARLRERLFGGSDV